MEDPIHIINLNGLPLTPHMIAAIVTAIETYGDVRIQNAAMPIHPGFAALTVGAMLAKGGYLPEKQ